MKLLRCQMIKRVMNVVYLSFIKAFDTVSHNNLIHKLGLDKWTVRLIESGWIAKPRELWSMAQSPVRGKWLLV